MLDFRPKRNKHGWRTNGKHLMNPSVCNKFRDRRKFILSYEGKRIGMGKLGKMISHGWCGPYRIHHCSGYEYEAKEHFLRISEGKHYNEVVEDLKRRTKELDRKYGLDACGDLHDRCLMDHSRYPRWANYYFDSNGTLKYRGTGRPIKVRGVKRKDISYNLEHIKYDLENLEKGLTKYYVGKLMVHLIPSGERIEELVDVWIIDSSRYNAERKGNLKDWIITERYQKAYVPGIGEQLYYQVIGQHHYLTINKDDCSRYRCFYFVVKK